MIEKGRERRKKSIERNFIGKDQYFRSLEVTYS
jgi:hypothetical protein